MAFVLVFLFVVISARADTNRPALLFLSRHLQASYGGSYLRKAVELLHDQGYRVAYYEYDDVYDKGADYVEGFDAIVMLNMPAVDISCRVSF